MKVRLVPLFPSPGEQPVGVARFPFVIGRAMNCDLRLESPLVSRYHCVLLFEEERVVVRDLGSSNGTFINRELIWGEVPLADGDLLGIAANSYQLRTGMPRSRIGLWSRVGHVLASALRDPIGANAQSRGQIVVSKRRCRWPI